MDVFKLSGFEILATGADGGHYYIRGEITYKGPVRKLVVFFENKSDEAKLANLETVTVQGELLDEGIQQSLLLFHSVII